MYFGMRVVAAAEIDSLPPQMTAAKEKHSAGKVVGLMAARTALTVAVVAFIK